MPWTAAAVVAGALITGEASKSAGKKAAAGQQSAIAEQRRQFDITQEQLAPYREAGLRGLGTYEEMLGKYGDYELPKAFSYEKFDQKFKFGAEEFQSYKDPGYEFRVEEGLRAIDRRMARSGQRGSGRRPRALMELGQNLASQEFGAARGRALQNYEIKRQQYQSNRSLALQEYTSRVAREQEQYGRSYTDPLARYGRLSQVGLGVTQELGRGRQSYAQSVGQSMANIGQYQAAGQLGQSGAYAQGIGALGNWYQGYQNNQNNQNNQQPQPTQYQPGGQQGEYGDWQGV